MPPVSAGPNDGSPRAGGRPDKTPKPDAQTGRQDEAPSKDGSKTTVTQQESGPDRSSLAIALENVTPEALSARSSGDAAPRGAPRVIASGRGAVAEQILQIAFDRGVKVRRDSDLAEILSVVEVDSEIPLAALAGVAEILRYLYQTDGQGTTAAGIHDARPNADTTRAPARRADEENGQ